MRLRLAAAEAADFSLRALYLPGAVLRSLLRGLAALTGRKVRPYLASELNGEKWPRSERLLSEFGKLLADSLPKGVAVRPPRGRNFFLRGTPDRPPPSEWPEAEGRQIVGMMRSFGFGFPPISGRADMPQSRPDDLARALAPLLKDVTSSLRRFHQGWPDVDSVASVCRTRADGDLIHMWWEDSDGQVVVELPDLDLRATGLA